MAEVVVGAGLAGIFGMGIIHTMKSMGDSVKTSRKKNTRLLMMNNLVRYGNRATQVVKDTYFHDSRSVYNSSRTLLDPKPVTYTTPPGKGNFTFKHKGSDKTIKGGSFEIQLARIGNNSGSSIESTGALFSRCIDESDIDRDFTVDEVNNMNTVPVLRYVGANKLKKIYCCSRKSLGCGSVVDKNSSYRPRIFYVNDKKVQMYPSPGQAHDMAGLGVNFFLDDASDPEGYQMILFGLENDCLQDEDKGLSRDCKDKNTVTVRIMEGMLAKDIHDSGMLILGQ